MKKLIKQLELEICTCGNIYNSCSVPLKNCNEFKKHRNAVKEKLNVPLSKINKK